jgi:NADPH:quinone reductase-like Zn-dependent oxidoreductase
MGTIKQRDVSTAQDLIAAVRDRTVDRIVISGDRAGAVLGTEGIAAIDDEEAAAKLEPVDTVADTVNGATAASLLGKVKAGGIFASVLGPPQNAGNFPSVKVVPVDAEADPEALLQMAKAVVEGKLRIPIVAKMALKDGSEAYILLSKGANGKALLAP